MAMHFKLKFYTLISLFLFSACASSQFERALNLHNRGLTALERHQVLSSIQHLKEADGLLKKLSAYALGRVQSLSAVNGLALGNAYREQGDWALAKRIYLEALMRAKPLRHPFIYAAILNNLGSLVLNRNDFEAANAYYREASSHASAENHLVLMSQIENGLGSVLLEQYDDANA